MVKIVCRRCQFRNDQYQLHCGNCGASLAPVDPAQGAVRVRNVWIGVLAGALLIVVAVLVVQRGGGGSATEAPAVADATKGSPAAGRSASPQRANEIPMPQADSIPESTAFGSSDPNCPVDELADFIEKTEYLEKEFTDGIEVAGGTSRLLLPTVVKDLQATRRDYASLGGPACTRSAHASVEKAMTTTIDALLLFMRTSSDDASGNGRVADEFRRARNEWEAARADVVMLKTQLADAS